MVSENKKNLAWSKRLGLPYSLNIVKVFHIAKENTIAMQYYWGNVWSETESAIYN